MAAECYWCKTGTTPGSIPNPVGKYGEPIGCCKQCQVFACGHHAERHLRHQEYKCFDCLFVKLISSSVAAAPIAKQAVIQLQLWDPVLFGRASDNDETYESYAEFKENNPGFNDWYPRVEEIDFQDFERLNPMSAYMRDFNFDARCLLVLAALIYIALRDSTLIGPQNAPVLNFIKEQVNG
jgi:hypothetical protein